MKILETLSLDYDDVLIKPRHSQAASRKDIILNREFLFYNSPRIWNGIPIIISNMSGVGRFEVSRITSKYKIITCLHKFYSVDDLIKEFNTFVLPNKAENYVWYSLGIKNNEFEKLKIFISKTGFQPNLCLDVANGHTDYFVNIAKKLRFLCPESIIMAGNIGIPECVYPLITNGVDICKVGIGSGKNCQTRKVTGIGVPQLSCNIECSDIAHGLKNGDKKLGLICGDGGISEIKHFGIGFCSGADFLMTGSFFAGTDSTGDPQDWVYEKKLSSVPQINQNQSGYSIKQEDDLDHKKYLKFFGMSSKEAQDRFSSGIPSYATSEGVCTNISYKGKLEDLIENVLGGLRSTGSYIGASDLKSFNKCANFIRIMKY